MLTIDQRRTISQRATLDHAFRDMLERDPRGAVSDATGTSLPPHHRIETLVETASRWAFVVPVARDLAGDLPDPDDARSAVENQVYGVLRDEPDLIAEATRDPRTFLFERFGVMVDGIDLRRETENTTIVVIPHQTAREELDDAMLDLVTGGGNQPINGANGMGSAKS